MRKSITALSLGYFIILIILSFFWPSLITGDVNKGDDIEFCVRLVAIVTFAYAVILKTANRKYSWVLPLALPIIAALISFLLVIIIGTSFHMNDSASLHAYFYIHGLVAVSIVFGVLALINSTRP